MKLHLVVAHLYRAWQGSDHYSCSEPTVTARCFASSGGRKSTKALTDVAWICVVLTCKLTLSEVCAHSQASGKAWELILQVCAFIALLATTKASQKGLLASGDKSNIGTLQLCMQVAELLADDAELLRVGRAAAAKARSWTQVHNAARLQELVDQACASPPASNVAREA